MSDNQIAVIVGRAYSYEDRAFWIVAAYVVTEDTAERAKRWVMRANALSSKMHGAEIDNPVARRSIELRFKFCERVGDLGHLDRWLKFAGWPEYAIETPSTRIPS